VKSPQRGQAGAAKARTCQTTTSTSGGTHSLVSNIEYQVSRQRCPYFSHTPDHFITDSTCETCKYGAISFLIKLLKKIIVFF
jgi:hypothetical protein